MTGVFTQARRWALDRLVQERLPAPLRRWVHWRLRQGGSWSAEYDALRKAERAAQGAPPLSAAQLALIEQEVLSRVGGQARAGRTRRRAAAWALGTSLAGAAAALWLVVLQVPDAATPRGGWRARGESSQGAAVVGLRVSCVARDGSRLVSQVEVGSRTPFGDLACGHDDLLGFEVFSRGAAPEHLFVVGVNARNGLRWLLPFGRDSGSVRVPHDVVGHALGQLADLSALPVDDQLSLFVLFRDQPISAGEIARAVDRAAGVHLMGAERLPVDADVQARVRLRLSPTGGQR